MTTHEKRRGHPFGISKENVHYMQKIVDFVKQYHKDKGYAPTLKEIAVGIGRKESDFGNIQPWVQQLIQEGFLISAGKNERRGVAVAKNPPRKHFSKSKEEEVQ